MHLSIYAYVRYPLIRHTSLNDKDLVFIKMHARLCCAGI